MNRNDSENIGFDWFKMVCVVYLDVHTNIFIIYQKNGSYKCFMSYYASSYVEVTSRHIYSLSGNVNTK